LPHYSRLGASRRTPRPLTEYLGSALYGEADLTGDGRDGWTASGTMRHLFPGGQQDAGGAVQYWHEDLPGSTMLTTDDVGDPPARGRIPRCARNDW